MDQGVAASLVRPIDTDDFLMKALYLERAGRAKRSTRGVNCARIGKEHIIALKSKGVCDCDESGKSRESEKEL